MNDSENTTSGPIASARNWLYELDRILRGEATRPQDLGRADIGIPVIGITVIVMLLGVLYGFCMGIFSLVHGVETAEYQRAFAQVFASMCKVPLLFLLTLVVTFPSLYVFNALVGSQLRVFPVLKLLIASMAVNLAVLASMGPILAFFSVSTPSYPFIVLLNVVVFSVAGALGLIFLIQTLNRLTVAQNPFVPQQIETAKRDAADQRANPDHLPTARPTEARPISPTPAGPLEHPEGVALGSHVRKVFGCWIVVFGLVGAQMGWVLRPFIGSPSEPFSWFRVRQSNFFEGVAGTIQNLFQ